MDGVGTYLKVVWSPGTSKAFIVLYLRPHGRFLFGGYWEGYEYSLAAGVWQKQGREIRLDGRGQLKTDTIPGPEGGKFERVFAIEDSNHTPVLRAATELNGWSLLGWRGDFVFVGVDTVIAPGWLPASMSAIDSRISEMVGV
jgi:hypothetical protein